jgi:hypothetical protein
MISFDCDFADGGFTPSTTDRDRVAQEARSVLYEMCNTAVNKERALLFCQMIASDFRCVIKPMCISADIERTWAKIRPGSVSGITKIRKEAI